MKNKIRIVSLNPENVSEYGTGCIANPKHAGYQAKLEWLKKRFTEGLKIKLLQEDGKTRGFIEYLPGEYAWRAVNAKGYIFIHCIWIYPKKYKGKGYGGQLLEVCLKEAKKLKKQGVSVITSEGPWIAGKNLFLKHGFKVVDEKDRFELLVKKFKKGKAPQLKKTEAEKYQGLNLLYSNQCPMAVKFVKDIEEFCKKEKIKLKITKLERSQEAQNNPCVYGTFTLIYGGKIVADNPISASRFRNIVNKELRLKEK